MHSVDNRSASLAGFAILSIGLTACVSEQRAMRDSISPPAVTQTMKRQVTNAVDAGDGDYITRTLREKLVADPQNLPVRLQLAERYQQLGYPELAIEHYRLASARFPQDASVAMKLAGSLRDFNHIEDAIGVLANFCDGNPAPPPDLLSLFGILGDDAGHYAEAEKLQRETLALQRRILGPEHPDTLRSMNNLANSLVHENHLAEALPLQRNVLSIKQRVLGPEHQDTLWAMKELAMTLQAQSQYAEAEKLQRQTLEIQRKVLGPERPNTLSITADLADTLNKEGRYSDAEQLETQTVDTMRRVLGPQHPFTLEATEELAQILDREGRYNEAEKLARTTLETQRRVLSPEHPDIATTTYDLGCILAHSGHDDEAFSLLREAISRGLDATTVSAVATTPDLKSLHKDSRFAALVVYAQHRAATGEPN